MRNKRWWIGSENEKLESRVKELEGEVKIYKRYLLGFIDNKGLKEAFLSKENIEFY